MLGKLCLALAVLVQINAYECNQQVAISSTGSCSQSYPVAVAGSVSTDSGAFGDSSSMSPVTRNLVAKGKYPVALENSEHPSERQIPVITSQISTPVQEKPTVRLPYNIPPPKTLSHTCTCYKTIMRPRVHQQIITVPSVQRYIETSHRPIIDSVQYEAVPVGYDGSSDASSQYQNVPVYQIQPVSQVQAFQVPQVEAYQVPQVQAFQVPQVQAIEVPQVQTVQVPEVRTVQVPQVQTVQVPQVQTVQVPEVRTVEIPQVQRVEVPSVQAVEIAQVRGSGSAFRGSFQVPQYQTVGSDQYDY